MEETFANNKIIFKNTLLLYMRMFLTIIIGLYVSRVVLRTLGVDDFGIYNVVGGIIVLFSFLSNALSRASQRYISFELGQRNPERVKRVFYVSIECQIIISLIVVVLAETVGLWFLNTQLNIPENRMEAANWVYQISILSFVVSLLQVPYNAMIISHERMSFYAYVSIVEALLKLGVAYLLIFASNDKLILYATLHLGVIVVVSLCYVIYCCRLLSVKVFVFVKDKETLRQLLSFSGWSMLGGGSNLVVQQGDNFLLNIFNGVAVNAACGVANQVTGMVYSFVSNFQYAFQPQIIKLYSAVDSKNLDKLIYRASSISYYLMLIIFIPFVVETNYVLELWLGKGMVPEYAVIFCQLMLAYFMFDAIQAPLWMLINATGNIKVYTIWSSGMALLNIPLAWASLKWGFPVYYVFVIKFAINGISSVIRTFYVKHVAEFSSSKYIKYVVSRALVVTAISFFLVYFIKKQEFIDIHPILVILLALVVTVASIWLLGFGKEDKAMVVKLIKDKIFKK